MFIQIFLMRYSSVSRANTTGAKKAIKSRQEKFSMAIKTGPYHTHCTNENVCPLILSQLINSCIFIKDILRNMGLMMDWTLKNSKSLKIPISTLKNVDKKPRPNKKNLFAEKFFFRNKTSEFKFLKKLLTYQYF